MFVLIQILRCGSGRQHVGLKRLHWIHGLMSAKEDSGGCVVAKHLGNPFDYLILRFWQTPEAMARGSWARIRRKTEFTKARRIGTINPWSH